MSSSDIRNKTAIVGVGTSDFGHLYRNLDPTRTHEELGVEAVRAALDDAGLKVSDIDGLITSGIPWYPDFAYRSGLREVDFLVPYPGSGRLCAPALGHAAMAVHHGLAKYVVLVYATNMRSVRQQFGGEERSGGDLFDHVFGMTSPAAHYAMLYDGYLQEFGYQGREDLLGAVAIAERYHATLNPIAAMQDPLDWDAYRHARFLARPLRLLDYCLVTDGAVCYIVTTAERARDLRKPAVLISGFAERSQLREWFVPEDYFQEANREMARDVLGGAGLGPKDIDSLQVYDNFSVTVPWALEGYGFCKRGEGLEWIQDGRIRLGGECPVNTSGGLMSEAYMQGWNNHAEAVRQLRGECGKRQVKDCNAILYANMGPISSASLLIRG